MENILALIIPVLLAVLVFKLLFSQVKLIWKIAVNSISGFICLWLLNLASGITGIVFEINFITTLIVGFLGIPGIILLLIGQFMK
ncbi:MAG: pro-sigmaK processing inhibitor BofA family protein [Oscillospiraceae bacterium]|nr:pro-sigmaK processing inhibitor BofA family protein [Oscillospiraceae bacterium]